MTGQYLIVVDMQKDFVTGALGSSEAVQIAPKILQKVKAFEGTVIFTQDTHHADYMSTQEGKLLPVQHCILETDGWKLIDGLQRFQLESQALVYQKDTFASIPLAADLRDTHRDQPIQSVELVGVCTDICVVSNALLLKAYLPEAPVLVDAACCAGVTPEKHRAALETMKSCQIIVREEPKR